MGTEDHSQIIRLRDSSLKSSFYTNYSETIIDRFGPEVEITARDKTSICIVATVSAGTPFYSWIFGFRGKVSIKSPDSVLKAYKDRVFENARTLKLL